MLSSFKSGCATHAAVILTASVHLQMRVFLAKAAIHRPLALSMARCRTPSLSPLQQSSLRPVSLLALTGELSAVGSVISCLLKASILKMAPLVRLFGPCLWLQRRPALSELCHVWRSPYGHMGWERFMLPLSILTRVYGALCRLATVPGTKLTSSYRGVSVNASTGLWTAVVWNPQTRAAQHIGDYTSELEVSFGPHTTTLAIDQTVNGT